VIYIERVNCKTHLASKDKKPDLKIQGSGFRKIERSSGEMHYQNRRGGGNIPLRKGLPLPSAREREGKTEKAP